MSVRFPGKTYPPSRRFQDKALREALDSIPPGVYEGANRYDTDDEHVLHLWRDGQSWDVRLARIATAPSSENPIAKGIREIRSAIHGPPAESPEAEELLRRTIRQYHGVAHPVGSWAYCDEPFCREAQSFLQAASTSSAGAASQGG